MEGKSGNSTYNHNQNQVTGNYVQGDVVGHVVANSGHAQPTQQINSTEHTSEQRQNLAKAQAEVQLLIYQLSQTNPTNEAVTEAIYQEIRRNPTLKARLQSALKAGGLEVLKTIFNHPLFSIPAETIKGYLEAE